MLRRRAIPFLLAAATLVPIGALGWLGSRILRQEQDVESQRRQENLKVAAGSLALAMEAKLSDIEENPGRGDGIRFTADGFDAPPGSSLLYGPVATPVEPVAAEVFASAEALEFQHQDLSAAAIAYHVLTGSSQPEVRASALNHLARVLRRSGDLPGALDAYASMASLGSVPVEGYAAALLAHQARRGIYEQVSDSAALRKETAALASDLYSGAWRIGKPDFDFYRDLLQQWGSPPPPPEAVIRTEAINALWTRWRANDLTPHGRIILPAPSGPVLAIWTGGPAHPVVWLATPAELEARLAPLWQDQHLAVSLSDNDGRPLFGAQRSDALSLYPPQTRLPFLLSVASWGNALDDEYRMRRSLLIAGLLATFAFMIAAAYGLYRVTTREMELVRQQSDFVSSVSHEFRTPLTSMRHLTELLASGNVPGESRKAQYYQLLQHETERLHRMVESLLSFGRIEAGAYSWHQESVAPGEVLAAVLDDFRQGPQAGSRELLCDIERDLPPIQADREALSRALWNLLENAGKYSDPASSIRVFAQRSGQRVLLGVEDHGSGITQAEQIKIFQKFVRGAEARRAGIRGVGIGLALVKRIAEAHGGSVRLTSELGRGSTFILELPCCES